VALLNPPGHALGRVNAIRATTSIPYVVEAFPGPLSIKWMPAGWAVWRTRAAAYRVDPSSYLVLDHGSVYSLTIDTPEPRESFCPFFAIGFVEDVHRSLTAPAPALLDDPFAEASMAMTFAEHLRPADDSVVAQLARMRDGVRQGLATSAWLDDQFAVLAERLLLAQREVQRQIASVPAARPATRAELYRRLCRGRDYLHASFAESPTLAAVAREACLAPHHFHRLFRRVFGRTPHDYVLDLRIARARTLLAETERAVSEICLDVGFESLGSFSSRFRREVGVSPTAFRRRARRN
jgi:AraC family transcriptional regulator